LPRIDTRDDQILQALNAVPGDVVDAKTNMEVNHGDQANPD
jgi:DNA-directed RNA polymerase subunit H (RpoH/RPB5)